MPHAAARCVECHLPHDLAPKLVAKAENGYHHSTGFTFQNFHEPIMIKEKNSAILQENCLRCHGELVHALVAGARTDADGTPNAHDTRPAFAVPPDARPPGAYSRPGRARTARGPRSDNARRRRTVATSDPPVAGSERLGG